MDIYKLYRRYQFKAYLYYLQLYKYIDECRFKFPQWTAYALTAQSVAQVKAN